MSHTVASINCNIFKIEKHTSFFFQKCKNISRKEPVRFSLCRIKPIAFLCTADNRLKKELEVAEGERISTYCSVSIRWSGGSPCIPINFLEIHRVDLSSFFLHFLFLGWWIFLPFLAFHCLFNNFYMNFSWYWLLLMNSWSVKGRWVTEQCPSLPLKGEVIRVDSYLWC